MTGEEQMMAAVKTRDAARVRELLEKNPGLLQMRTPQGSLVLTALYSGAGEVLSELLARGPQLDIYEAASVGDGARVAQLLAEEPSLANAPNADGFTPLGLAAFFGRPAAVAALLAGGAQVNLVSQSNVPYVPSNTALHAAIAGGANIEAVRLLLEAGADLSIRDSNGHLPLHVAAFHTNPDLIDLLIERKAEVGAAAADGRTALAIARSRGNESVAQRLRAHGAGE